MSAFGDVVLFFLSVAVTAITADPKVWLDVPEAGDCRGDTFITCHYKDRLMTTWTWSRKYGDKWETPFIVNGTQIGPNPNSVREEKVNGSFSLIIVAVDNMARGFYRCAVGNYESEGKYLNVECKPDSAIVTRTADQHLQILLADVHPIPKISLTLMDSTSRKVTLDFQSYCGGFRWTVTCKWVSTTPLQLGRFSYKLVVTTITDTTFTGIIN